MSSQVLFLFDGVEPDSEIVQHLHSRGLKIQSTQTLARAMQCVQASRVASTAQHNNESSTNPEEALFHVILAEVTAGGVSLAEYAIEQYMLLSVRPVIVLLDTHGDISAARRAIRLGVDAYLLASEAAETRRQMLDQAIDQAAEQIALGFPSGFSSYEANGNYGTDVMPAHVNGSTHPMHTTALRALSPRAALSAGFAGIQLGVINTPAARLSTIENAIIDCLSHQAGIPVSARAIVNKVMGRDLDEDKAASLLRPHISRLRSKLEPLPQMPQHLLTVRGKGYMVV